MKLKDLLKVLRSNAKIIDWNTMEEVGEYNDAYAEILDKNMNPLSSAEVLEEREVVFINNFFNKREDTIRIGIK